MAACSTRNERFTKKEATPELPVLEKDTNAFMTESNAPLFLWGFFLGGFLYCTCNLLYSASYNNLHGSLYQERTFHGPSAACSSDFKH